MMSKNGLATRETVGELVERMVRRYVRDLVSADELVELLTRAWRESMHEAISDGPVLESLARGLCSQVLYEACQQPAGRVRDLAFERLSEYLERALRDAGGTLRRTAQEVREEVLQDTLVEILKSMQRARGKPEQPMAFLGWARVILHRQLTRYWHHQPRVELLSLEGEDEPQFTDMPDEHTLDPLLVVLQCEQRMELHTAISSLRNPNYRAVLRHIYFGELEANEVADLLETRVADIYVWHHRALHALQKQVTTPVKQSRFSLE